MTKPIVSLGLIAFAVSVAGCSRPQPVTMAPPVPQPPVQQAPAPGSAGVFNWQDVPQGQQVPINRAIFDQGGYQMYAASGETIVVPFVNQNMYVMKFGRSNNGGMYFVNEGAAPTLYVPNGGFLENAAAQNARWYPFSNNYSYTRPVYIGLAPTWGDYLAMGWYPGMTYYGGYWGYNPWRPGFAFTPMIGLNFNIGGRPYYGWDSYRNYYTYNSAGRIGWNNRSSYNYASVNRRSPGTGSFGRTSFGSTGRSTGSFGSTGRSGGSSFGRSSGSTGSFGGSRNNFGTASNRPGTGFFGSGGSSSFGRSSGGSSFGSGSSSFGSRPSSGSFGGSSSGFGTTSRSRGSFGSGSSGFSGGSSFGRSSGSSFGGGSSSFGRSSGSSSSFGRSSGSSSFGRSSGSFGGGRRR
ncbi:MAG: hypothetical protein SFU56_14145 [Capsulimonadales bacterium]|nr:hypothetical protein [Capsulimonadales bacterium]